MGMLLPEKPKRFPRFSGGSMHRTVALVALILICQTVFSAPAASPDKINIAVSDLTGQGLDQATAVIISDRLRTELFNTGAFKVLERQSMQDILKEQGFQQSGCVSDRCMVEIGQMLGVANIVAGTIGKIGGIFTLNIRMINVQTGEILYTASVDCKCAIEDVLTSSVPAVVRKIAASVSKPSSSADLSSTNKKPAPYTVKPTRKHTVAPKIVFGAVALGTGIAGIVFNSLTQGKIDHDAELKKEYAGSGILNSSGYQSQLGANASSARNLAYTRNAMYIVSIICAAGFGVSFAF
jgi:TolB-like protein